VLAGRPDTLPNLIEGPRDQVSRLIAERDQFAAESTRWFDAAVIAGAERIAQMPRSGKKRGLQRLCRFMLARAWRTKAASIDQADRARDAGQWERAARFYLDALAPDPDASPIWRQLGHALDAVGKHSEAEFAYRQAALGGSSRR
jgi:tetratricopeptide (TPR) repeat protein